MHFSTIFAATAAMAGSALAAEHTVAVGTKAGELIFKPDNIEAAEGDMIHFKFWPKNHSVAQSTFAKPCEPMQGGFWSGFVPTSDAEKVASTSFTYEVKNASAPIWFYCTQGKHCQAGMVGVINAPKSGDKTLDAFKTAAKAASNNVSPASTAGTGGELAENSTSTSPSGSSGSGSSASGSPTGSNAPQSTGAASHMAGSALFAGLAGAFTFFML
jgi:plastocyanin